VPDTNDLASRIEAEATQCRGFAAKFKKKAQNAKLPVKKMFYSALERRYTLLAEVNQREAEKLRALDIRTATPDDGAKGPRADPDD
jgi:hypothetical protein